MIDFALIDSTVNEWMAEVEKEQNASRRAAELEQSQSKELENAAPEAAPHISKPLQDEQTPSARTHYPTSPGPKSAMKRVYKALRNTEAVRKPVMPPRSNRAAGKMDRVLTVAMKENVITEAELTHWMSEQGSSSVPQWRTLCRWVPERAHVLERTAAEVYGFRPVLICQMSTLVLADLLTMRIPDHYWRPMMETGVIPVVEHGAHPDPAERVVCVSHDPSHRAVRALLDDIKAFRPELAYADKQHIRTMMELMGQHVPTIGAQVYTTRPALKRIESTPAAGKAA